MYVKSQGALCSSSKSLRSDMVLERVALARLLRSKKTLNFMYYFRCKKPIVFSIVDSEPLKLSKVDEN